MAALNLSAASRGVERLDAHLIFTVMDIHDVRVPTRVETTVFPVDI